MQVMKAIISLHDIMPETLDSVEAIIHWLEQMGIPPFSLLIVPGKAWDAQSIKKLRNYSQRGYPIVPHGWHHHTRPRKLFHHLHAALISKDVAEHLDLDGKGILNLLVRSKQWFIDQAIPVSELYVPPAWALGFISPATLARAPFSQIEVTRGVLHLKLKGALRFEKLPLTGYEADSTFRVQFLRRWNAHQESQAKKNQQALRISIHPHDLKLPLAGQLEAQLKRVDRFINYSDLSPQ